MKAHICIGGPLNGEFATSKDFYGEWDPVVIKRYEGMYNHLRAEYVQFNNASRPYNTGQHGRHRAQVAWIHIDCLPPSISPRNR